MTDPAVFFVALCAYAILMVALIWKCELLKGPAAQAHDMGKIALMSPLIGFLLFVSACAFVPGWTSKLIHYTDTHGYSSFTVGESDNFSQLMALVVSFVLLLGFSRIHSEAVRVRIWGQGGSIKAFCKGIFYCIVVYPIVMTLVQGIHLAVEWFGVLPIHEQVALSQLKAIQSYPWLFWSFALSVVTLVPLVEEFLFRGLLQNYLGNFFGPKLSIILTSLLFAFFHYSGLQGATNIELMIGLFIYSYFIGLFYMKERSLWTPIAMHAAFNALTIFIMFYVIK